MKALKLHVERIVRPIRASKRRQDRFREELLAHLLAAVAEQRDALGEDEAVRAAIERLGPEQEVRRALVATVPAWERAMSWSFGPLDACARWLDERYAGEPPLRHAWRWLWSVVLIDAAVAGVGLVVVALLAPSPRWGELRRAVPLMAWILAHACAYWFCLVYCYRRVRRALYGEDGTRRSWPRAAAWALAAGLEAGLSGLALFHWWPVLDPLPAMVLDRPQALALAAVAGLTPLAAVTLAVASAREKRRFEDWGRFDVDG